MNYKILVLLLSLYTCKTFAKKTEKIFYSYYNKTFGHLHQNPSKYSSSLTTITCNQGMKVLEEKVSVENSKEIWQKVKIGPYEGFVQKKHTDQKWNKKKCVQDRYPRVFDLLELKISDFHYWGLLYDHYLLEKSEIQ